MRLQSHTNTTPVLELTGVSKTYGRQHALRDLNLALGTGVSYGLIGRNGAGKSTALRIAMGLLRPTAGRARLFGGDPIAEAERVKVHVGYVAEDQVFPGELRPVDLFRFYASCYPSWDAALLGTLVEQMRLPTDRALSKLSKGQARQVALLCAVAHRPKLLILDEPAGGLDPVARRGLLEGVIELLANEETTVVFSSHNLQEIERVATRVGVLHEGRLVLDDDIDRLREGSCHVLADLGALQPQEALTKLPGAVAARAHAGGIVFTLLCGEEEGAARVKQHLGGRVQQTQRLSLEDLFIDLVRDAQ